MSGTGNPTTTVVASGDSFIDGVLTTSRWSDATIHYSFPTSNSVYSYTTNTFLTSNFSALSTQQKDAAHFALNTAYGGSGFSSTASAGFSVEGFTNLGVFYDSSADTISREHIRLANTSSGVLSTARVSDFPGNSETTEVDDNGDVWFGGSGTTPTAGNYHWHTVIHEIGHALGLSHGHSTFQMGVALPAAFDSMEYSIMTYRSYSGGPTTGYTNETWGYAQTYMMADIAALQYMYGADYTTNSGNTVYSWDPSSGDTLVNGSVGINAGGNRIFATIWDGGGIDTYDLSAYSSNLTLDLQAGGYSYFSATQIANLGGGNYASGNIYNALMFGGNTASLIENAIGGSGDDIITGNEANNTLTGGLGDDTLSGLAGNDTFSYTAADAPTGLTENIKGGSGTDRILLNGAGIFDFGNSFNVNSVEEIEFAADGSFVDKTLIMGNKELDQPSEFLNVLIDGNSSIGANDSIIVNMGFSATLTLAGWSFIGWDTTFSSDSITINGTSGNDTITGSSQTDTINGNGGDDTINGGGGNDTIVGGGGTDTLNGNAGNDTLSPGAAGISYFETYDGGSGTDTIDMSVMASAGYNINLDSGVLHWPSSGFSAAPSFIVIGVTANMISIENVIGAGGNDNITGTSGDNVLQGGGGNDLINGGGGNDELDGDAGNDTLKGGGGTDTLNGGAGNDILEGGYGTDTVNGGNGDDTIIVRTGEFSDNVDGGGGTDLFDVSGRSDLALAMDMGAGTYTLMGAANTITGVENVSGTGLADTITGDANANVISGNGGNDALNGGGGNDRLNGGAGKDHLIGAGGMDRLFGNGGSDILIGGNGKDKLFGGGGKDKLFGGSGNDKSFGGGGNDKLFGGNGKDKLTGNGGKDVLDGGHGNDKLTGGAGQDFFLFKTSNIGADVVKDFTDNVDTLKLDNALWGNTPINIARVINDYSSVVGADVVFDFGGGNTITLTGFGATGTAALADDIILI